MIQINYSDIQKLRTTPPLFRAYEQVYNNLEDNLCPQFYTSDEVRYSVTLVMPALLITVFRVQYLKLVLGNRLPDCRPDMKMRDDDSSKYVL